MHSWYVNDQSWTVHHLKFEGNVVNSPIFVRFYTFPPPLGRGSGNSQSLISIPVGGWAIYLKNMNHSPLETQDHLIIFRKNRFKKTYNSRYGPSFHPWTKALAVECSSPCWGGEPDANSKLQETECPGSQTTPRPGVDNSWHVSALLRRSRPNGGLLHNTCWRRWLPGI